MTIKNQIHCIFLLLITAASCSSPKLSNCDCTEVYIYAIPSGILSPISISRDGLLQNEPVVVSDEESIEELMQIIQNLSKTTGMDGIDHRFVLQLKCEGSNDIMIGSNNYISIIGNTYYKPSLEFLDLVSSFTSNKSSMAQNQKSQITNYITSYNNFDVAGMLIDLADDVVFENVANGEINLRTEGLKDFEEQANAAKQYFTERKQTITSWDIDGAKVTIELSYRAILAIDLPNGMKAGETLEMKGISEFIFESEKIKSIKDIS